MFEFLLTNFSEIHRILVYVIVFLGMFVEGEAVLLLAGILVRSGKLDYFDTIFIAFIAVLLHDIVYWFIGRKVSESGRKKIWFFNLGKLEPFLDKIKKNDGLYIFVSKFAWNLNRIILMANGYLKTSFNKLIRYTLPAAFIWTVTFVSLGFVFANKIDILKKDVKTVAILFMAFLLGVIFLENIIQRIFNKDE